MHKIPTTFFISNKCGLSLSEFKSFARCAPKLYWHTSRPKPNGSHRKISAPDPRLKAIQRKLADCLAKLPLEDGIYGGPKTSIMDAVWPHCDKPLLIKMDLKNFYPSIKARRVRNYFKTILDEPALASEFTRLCTTQGHLAQGAPSSPVLARLVMEEAFIAAKRALKEMDERCEVSVWVDDVTISGPAGIKKAQKTIQRIFEKHGFAVNELKTEIIEGEQERESLGLIAGKVLSPCKATVRRYHDCLKHEPSNEAKKKGYKNFFRSIQHVNERKARKPISTKHKTTSI